ncbi:Isopentenyl-diphosphate Delta-isomerase 1 [Frankliniella fusca]|uniref:isopentenyl-diphosphate Delta-isomerase n=1 Tax=Frankliniella fusca TaxID=407009 RepID=A0AAE1LX56_9NEOP|nr:Isopentenyl-diphosphate Delta-isomerase 1 [Frankliniella fusca]
MATRAFSSKRPRYGSSATAWLSALRLFQRVVSMLSLGKCTLQLSFSRLLSSSASGRFQKMNPLQTNLPEDQCILVDANDSVIGEECKSKVHTVTEDGELLLHRAFSVFLFNTHGELLLQKRSACKVTYANYYTNTCCSHPLANIPKECIEKDALGIRYAAQRRLQIELGIPPEQAKPEEFKYLTRIHYFDKGDGKFGEHEIDYILFLQKDVTLDINPDEVSEVKYIKREDFKHFISNLNEPITPWFALIAKNQLHKWWANLDQLEKFQDHGKIHKYV